MNNDLTPEQYPAAATTAPETPRQRAKRHAELLQQADNLLGEALSILQEVLEEKQETFDERSERWQESEKGAAAQEELGWLENASTHIEEAQGSLAELVA